jgi:3-methyladenine DNA glycosylase/8-oxoguanine DNA glycosylase
MSRARIASLSDATRALAALDPVMADLIAVHGPLRLRPQTAVNERFRAIARAIAYQQLAGKAAAAIWGRTMALTGDAPFDAASVLALDDAQLRGAGLSGAKVAALRDLALQVDTGTVRLDGLGRMTNDEVVAELTKVRGIGPWTAHMFLMFDLRRADVWPTGDFGVRNGYRIAYDLPELPEPRELDALGERFRPFRSVAAWYCWRAVDGLPPS